MSDQNKEIVRKAIDRIWNDADFTVLEQTYAAGYVHRGNWIADTPGLESLKQIVAGLRTAFPDGRFTVERLVAEADLVVLQWHFKGTHRGEWLGAPGSGNPVDFTGTSIVRLAAGRIAEQVSADWDCALLFRQMGALADPAAVEANRALCRAWLDAFNTDDPADVDRIVSADFLYQATGLPDLRGGEAIKDMIRSFRKALPDGCFVLDESVATAGGGVNRWSYSGTHRGEWLGFTPTGGVVRANGTTWIRTSGGRIVHQWCDWDAQGFFAQLRGSAAAAAGTA